MGFTKRQILAAANAHDATILRCARKRGPGSVAETEEKSAVFASYKSVIAGRRQMGKKLTATARAREILLRGGSHADRMLLAAQRKGMKIATIEDLEVALNEEDIALARSNPSDGAVPAAVKQKALATVRNVLGSATGEYPHEAPTRIEVKAQRGVPEDLVPGVSLRAIAATFAGGKGLGEPKEGGTGEDG